MTGPLDAAERAQLSDLLDQLGPEAPTLLAPWTRLSPKPMRLHSLTDWLSPAEPHPSRAPASRYAAIANPDIRPQSSQTGRLEITPGQPAWVLFGVGTRMGSVSNAAAAVKVVLGPFFLRNTGTSTEIRLSLRTSGPALREAHRKESRDDHAERTRRHHSRRDPSRVVSRAVRACSAELAVAQGRVVPGRRGAADYHLGPGGRRSAGRRRRQALA